jgi:hypothetical protein
MLSSASISSAVNSISTVSCSALSSTFAGTGGSGDSRSSALKSIEISVNARMAGRYALNTLAMLPEPQTQARNAVHSSGVRPMPNWS